MVSASVEFIISPDKLFGGINSFSNVHALNRIHCDVFSMRYGAHVLFRFRLWVPVLIRECSLDSLIIPFGTYEAHHILFLTFFSSGKPLVCD